MLIAVTGFTFIYKLLPFKNWKNKKPKFTLFPKYIAQFNKPTSEIESSLKKFNLRKIPITYIHEVKFMAIFQLKL